MQSKMMVALAVVLGLWSNGYGQKQNDFSSVFSVGVPTYIGAKKLGDRLRSGHCNLNFSGDSLINPCCRSRLFAGLLRTIPVPTNGITMEHRTGVTGDMGIRVTEIDVEEAGRTYLQPSEPTLFPLSIAQGIVHEPRVEYAFNADIPDNSNLYGMFFMGGQKPNYTDWADWSWIGQPGMTCRVLYYEHERAPGAVELITLNSDVSSNPTITTMKTSTGIEGIGWTDIIVERSDAATFTDSFGVYLRTASGYIETGPTGEEGLVMLGCRYWVPGRPGVQISTLSYGGSHVSNHLDLTHMSYSNLSKFIEACQIDTPVLWMHDPGIPVEYATLVERWAERMKQAINTARINDPSIQIPMPVIVATWPSPFPNVNALVPAMAAMVANHPDYVFININKLVEDAYGPWENWQEKFTLDGLHPSIAGSDVFTQLFFNEALTGGCRQDIAPPEGNNIVNIEDLLECFAQWGTNGSADFDGNGIVDTSDLLTLFANWGPCK